MSSLPLGPTSTDMHTGAFAGSARSWKLCGNDSTSLTHGPIKKPESGEQCLSSLGLQRTHKDGTGFLGIVLDFSLLDTDELCLAFPEEISLELGSTQSSKNVQPFNKDFPSLPTFVFGICLWVTANSQIPLLFGTSKSFRFQRGGRNFSWRG